MRACIRDTEMFFDVDGMSLVADGSCMRERAVAFLFPGGPGSDHSALKARYGMLRDKMQVVYFDYRGHGRSARGDPRSYTLDEYVEDVEGLRRYLGLGPIVSLGTSFGGMVAMAHAARYPESVSQLVLVATAAHGGCITRAKQIVAERGTAEQIAKSEELFGGRLDTPEKLGSYYEVMGPLYSRKFDPALAKAGLERGILSPDALNRAFGRDGFMLTFDLRPELRGIRAPTLILAGRHDWICAPEFSEEMHRLIPGSDLRIFEESSHSIGADEPQKLVDVVSGFLVYRARSTR